MVTHASSYPQCFLRFFYPPLQVFATRGAQHVQIAYSGERTRISVVIFINAAGGCLPPVILLKGSEKTSGPKSKAHMMAEWPEARYCLTECATQTEGTFVKCMEYFIEMAGSGNLLVIDAHSSRNSLEAMVAFRESGNKMFTIPANSSHVTQPVDVGVAKALNARNANALSALRLGSKSTPGLAVSMDVAIKALKTAWSQVMASVVDAATGKNVNMVAKSFKKAGIYPVDQSVIPASMYTPALHHEAEVKSHRPTQEVVTATVAEHLVIPEAGEITRRLKAASKELKREYCVPECTLLTSDMHTAKMLEHAESKLAAVQEKGQRKAARIAKCAATVAAKAAAKEARLARQAEKAAGVKRKRTSAPEAAPVLVGVQRPAGVVEGSPSAAGKRKRGVSRVRVGVVALPAAKRRKVARIEISR